MLIDRRTFLKGSSLTGLALAAPAIIGRAQAADNIKLASILDQSGGLDIYGKPMADCTQMAVDELNAGGGLLGRKIDLINYDPQSTIQYYTQYATQAAVGDKADVVHAGITSASREAIRPIFDRYQTLYFYNTQYEGGVCDRDCFCTGSTPAQTVEKLVPYAMKKFGKKVYIIAADYNYGQITAQWVKKYVTDNGGSVADTEFFPLDVTNFGPTINKIQAAKPDMVWSALVGGAHISFYRQYAAAGMNKSIPIASTTFGVGNEHKLISAEEGNGILAAYTYFEEVELARQQGLREALPRQVRRQGAGPQRACRAQLRGHHAVGRGGQEGRHDRAHEGYRGARVRSQPGRAERQHLHRPENQSLRAQRLSGRAQGPGLQHRRELSGAAAIRHAAGVRPGGQPGFGQVLLRERPGGGGDQIDRRAPPPQVSFPHRWDSIGPGRTC